MDLSGTEQQQVVRARSVDMKLASGKAQKYVELDAKTNFSFLQGASHPEELVERAAELGYRMIGIADRHSLAGIVRAHVAAKKRGMHILVGASVRLRKIQEDTEVGSPGKPPRSSLLLPPEQPLTLIFYPHNRRAYARLSTLLSIGKLRAPKGECFLGVEDVVGAAGEMDCLAVVEDFRDERVLALLKRLREAFGEFFSLVFRRLYLAGEEKKRRKLLELSHSLEIPLVASNAVTYHVPRRRILQDILTCIRFGCTIDEAGYLLHENTERHLKPPQEMQRLFRKYPRAVRRAAEIAERASGFSLDELRYEYPAEICPEGKTPEGYLRELTYSGAAERYPAGVPPAVAEQIEYELKLIAELRYEKYFLTVHDIVRFARSQKILCQGRGAAANSAVCYVLGVTAVDPARIRLLMERFISKERNEPPDIDIDFEHERREEVIQYIYRRYGRSRAAIVAEVICYRTKMAFRDIGKAFGLPLEDVENLIRAHRNFGTRAATEAVLNGLGLTLEDQRVRYTILLCKVLRGFPRHLSQHVGGFVVSDVPISEIVPIENAAMEDRTILEWDKDDVDAMGMLKIDILALGMLTAIRKAMDLVNQANECFFEPPSSPQQKIELHTIPPDDPAVFDMVCNADTIGVFQIESRAQMSMLPRLRPRCYYDLVVEVAIVRPGPIQGGMVHPYLRRRMKKEVVTYPDERVKSVLESTLGVPIFQEQVMELSIVAAGFTPGEADDLRRAMGKWRKDRNLLEQFRGRIREGMLQRGYTEEFAERLFEQIQGFGEYGFPQSHSASFALLVYVSSWLKYYYPAAFTAALINSQPMGFYQPAQLIQCAKNHGVEVMPVDVTVSEWDCTLESVSPRHAFPRCDSEGTKSVGRKFRLRLGMRLVRSLSEADAVKISDARKRTPFKNILDLWRRSGARVPLRWTQGDQIHVA